MRRCLLVVLFLFGIVKAYGQACTLDVTITQSDPVLCAGQSITLTAVPSGGTPAYSFLWSTGQTTASITITNSGTYSVQVSDNTQGCTPVTRQITITQVPTPAVPTVSGTTICRGATATLTATAPGGTYEWYDAPSGGTLLATGDTFTTPALTATTNYFVQAVSGGCPGSRAVVTVTVNPNPQVNPVTVCGGTAATLTAGGSGGIYQWFDVPAGGAALFEGSNFVTPVLQANTTYYVQAVQNGCFTERVPVTVTVTPQPAAPTASGTTICAGSTATLTASGGGVYRWYTVPVGGSVQIISPDFTTPPLSATTTFYVESTVNGCTSQRTPVTVTVNPIPAVPAVPNITICSGGSVTLTASAPGGDYVWFDVPSRGNPIGTGPSYTTPVLSRTTTYYVQTTIDGCTSARAAVTVTVSSIPPAPTVNDGVSCNGSPVTLTATGPGGNYQWYDAAAGGNLLASGTTYTTPPITANTTYYVQTTLNGCTGSRRAVQVTLVQSVPDPVVNPASGCIGSGVTLSIVNPGNGVYAWYDAPVGGNLLLVNNQYTTPPLTANTTYYVEQQVSTCSSNRVAVTVTVTPIPPAPTAAGTTVCPNTSATLTASGSPGTYEWYDDATGGTLLGTGATFTSPNLGATTHYFVQSVVNGCAGPRTQVTVNIITTYNPGFRYQYRTFCNTSTVDPFPVILDPAGGVFSVDEPGLVFTNTTTGEIDISATMPGTYTVRFRSNGPCATQSAITVFITATPDPGFAFPQTSYCVGSPNPFPVYTGGAQIPGELTATPAGLEFTPDGAIDLARSVPGTYTIFNTIPNGGGACPALQASQVITINPSPTVNAGPDQAVTAGTVITLAGTIGGGAASARWTTSGSGTFSNNEELSASYTPGAGETDAVLTLTTDPGHPCGPRTDQMNVTIMIDPPTARGVSICSGGRATLTATAPGGTYQWYDAPAGGNLLVTDPSFVTPPLSADAIYYVQTTIAGLTSSRTAVNVTVNPIANPPVVSNVSICPGTLTTLTASGPSGTYQWYDAATGGNLLNTGTSFTTPILTQNTTYYVQNTLNGCSSARTPVTVSMNPVPEITSGARRVVCSLAPFSYTITSDRAGATYLWARTAVAQITNPAVTGQPGSVINETLISTAVVPVDVIYTITPYLNGCAGPSFDLVVTVDPSPVVTSAATGSICTGSASNYTIEFNMPGTGFSWRRNAVPGIANPTINGQTSATIREVLTNTTNAPIDVTYIFEYSFNGCAGLPFNFVVTVNPIPNITSPSNATICNSTLLNYAITSAVAGTTYSWSRAAVTGISNPAVQGQTSASITETLTNTTTGPLQVEYLIIPSANGCTGPTFTYTVTVNPTPPVPQPQSNTPVCLDGTINLEVPEVLGATYSWQGPAGFTSSLRTPSIPRATMANAGNYSVTITLNGCISPVGTTTVVVRNPPVVDAGPDRLVPLNRQITLESQSSDPDVEYLWTPGLYMNDSTARNPVITGRVTQLYTLTITDRFGCSSQDQVLVTVLLPPVVPNTFTPNGDGINDVWNIAELRDYPGAVVHVYNRYGEKLFTSKGYEHPWDGTHNGSLVPVGVYYYVIDTLFPGYILSGWIMVTR